MCCWRLISYFPQAADVRSRREVPWGRSDRPRPGEPSSAATLCQPKARENCGVPATPAGWKDAAVSRSCSPALGYLRWHKIVGDFSWICSVVSDFHPFICFTAGSGDWNSSGVPTHTSSRTTLSRRIFFIPKAFNRVRYNFSIYPNSFAGRHRSGSASFFCCVMPNAWGWGVGEQSHNLHSGGWRAELCAFCEDVSNEEGDCNIVLMPFALLVFLPLVFEARGFFKSPKVFFN